MQAYYLIPANAGITGPVDPGYGIPGFPGRPVDPGWGVPGSPGHPSQGLPGGPWSPGGGHPSQGLPWPGFPGHPSQGLPFPGRPVDPGWGVGGPGTPDQPIVLPPGSEVPPDMIWPPAPPTLPGQPPSKPVVPPDKLAILIFVLGVGHKWMVIDKSSLPAPGQPLPVPPGVPQPK